MSSGTLTCGTCQCLFETVEHQRAHFKEDYHGFNLKRKLANLKPVSREQYEAKQEALLLAEQQYSARCTACKKEFSSEAALTQHLGSRKHKARHMKDSDVIQIGGEEPVAEPVAELDEEALIARKIQNAVRIHKTQCLGCGKDHPSVEKALDHMYKEHGLFLPDLEYLVDLDGLLLYLSKKLGLGCCCLYCDRMFDSLEAVRGHMRDKFHCKLNFENGMDEFEDYYDYSAAYEHLEGVNDYEELKQYARERVHVSDDGAFLVVKLGNSTKLIGHRSYKRYFDQRLPFSEPTVGTVLALREQHSRVIETYQKRGLSLTTYNPAMAKERREKDSAMRRQQRKQMKSGIHGNKNLQHHFRRRDLQW